MDERECYGRYPLYLDAAGYGHPRALGMWPEPLPLGPGHPLESFERPFWEGLGWCCWKGFWPWHRCKRRDLLDRATFSNFSEHREAGIDVVITGG
jgi:hypothetical protein